VPSISIVANDK